MTPRAMKVLARVRISAKNSADPGSATTFVKELERIHAMVGIIPPLMMEKNNPMVRLAIIFLLRTKENTSPVLAKRSFSSDPPGEDTVVASSWQLLTKSPFPGVAFTFVKCVADPMLMFCALVWLFLPDFLVNLIMDWLGLWLGSVYSFVV